MNAARNRVITELRERIASMESPASRKAGALPFQVAEVDAALPGGGLAYGALHEVSGGGAGAVDGAAAALFAAGIAARTTGPIVWCLTRPDLFFPALAQVGLHPDRVYFVESDKEEDVLANAEEALAYGGCVCRWWRAGGCSLPPKRPGRWRWLSGAGGGRRRHRTTASRPPRPHDGG